MLIYCNCGKPIEGRTNKCASCNREDRKSEASNKKPKVFYKIRAKTKERAKQDKIYAVRGPKYLEKNPFCECGCGKPSQQIHHKKGRTGDLFLNEKYWMAVHSECHSNIENNPEFAIKMGYSLKRNYEKEISIST